MTTGLPAWVAAPALDAAWARIGDSLERRGLVATGSVVVDTSTHDVRRVVGELVGRSVTAQRCRVDLARLDARLRSRAGLAGGLVDAAQRAGGRTLVDRPALAGEQAARREAPFAAVRQWLAAHAGLASEPWVEAWLAGLRADGRLTRRSDGAAVLTGALAVLHSLRGAGIGDASGDASGDARSGGGGSSTRSRTDLAARVLHDAHALDDGTPVAALVLRALATAAGAAVPTDAPGRRTLWEGAGVVSDQVSSTCLVLGLPALGDGPRERGLQAAGERGDPVHLTPWHLARAELRLPAGTHVRVCENPRVLEAFAQRFAGQRAVVCTSGRPTLVVRQVLLACARSGARLSYHGDFDWPGVAIAHQVMDLCGARPWQMGADDYLSAPAGLALEGAPVEPRWDADLGAAMRRRGAAVHEEAVLARLLDAAS